MLTGPGFVRALSILGAKRLSVILFRTPSLPGTKWLEAFAKVGAAFLFDHEFIHLSDPKLLALCTADLQLV
jgi:hypothetical protein